ncbi:MAG: cobalamin transport system substrate-binding protein [Chloroflexota bacterium]|jgi:iron complex transport system substrate-binding protein|nr:cobalamin transport system substrate-binding protein [Chloroflexota bacterium]
MAVILVAGACGGATATPVSIPPNATASIVPPASGTPEPTETPEPAATFPLTLTDDEGTQVALASEPTKIVSLTPATTEVLFKIGAGPRVIATTDFDDYPPEAVALPDVASFTAIDIEKIVAMDADLVVAGGNGFNPPDQLAKLRNLGIPVLVVYARNVAAVLADIELVGDAVGEGPAAHALTATMQAGFDRVVAATQSLAKPRTFYEIDTTGAIYGPSDESFLAGMIDQAGGDPITTGDPNKYDISLEKLVAADPEVIVLGDAAYGATPAIVKARPGWGTMTAVKTGAIRPAMDILITRPGPRLVEGLVNLAVAIHPELATVLSTP